MNIVNRAELKIDQYKKCYCVVDGDCSMGELYDYAYALIEFAIKRIEESKPKPKQEQVEDVSNPV